MSTALYRRYRPETFADVIGQEHVTEPLMTALQKNRVNHAYLFSGPRGCGKTTSARILARCLNCEQGPTPTPCGQCESCRELSRDGSGSLDVIEMDAASHGGVDHARDLRERATFAPVRDRYKIFIIDEAHMVTREGFNALLKIVEEPPEHIKFIFATTEPNKVLSTIRSRTHHYPFRLVAPEVLRGYLKQLCEREDIEVEQGVLPLVVRAGAGSVRDSLSVLDQLMAGAGEQGITYDLAVALLGFTHAELLDSVVDSFAAGDSSAVFQAVDRVIQTGQDPRRFVEDLLERFRDLIIVKAVPESAASILHGMPEDQIDRMRGQATQLGAAELSRAADIANSALTEMTGATSPQLHLELLCARILLPTAEDSSRGVNARVDRLERRINMGSVGAVAAPLQADQAAATTPETPAEHAASMADGGMTASRQEASPGGREAALAMARRNRPVPAGQEDAEAQEPDTGEQGAAAPGADSWTAPDETVESAFPAPDAAPSEETGQNSPAASPAAGQGQPPRPAEQDGAPSASSPASGDDAPQSSPDEGQQAYRAQPTSPADAGQVNLVERSWADVVAAVGKRSKVAQATFRECRPARFENGVLYVASSGPGIQSRVERYAGALSEAVQEILGLACTVALDGSAPAAGGLEGSGGPGAPGGPGSPGASGGPSWSGGSSGASGPSGPGSPEGSGGGAPLGAPGAASPAGEYARNAGPEPGAPAGRAQREQQDWPGDEQWSRAAQQENSQTPEPPRAPSAGRPGDRADRSQPLSDGPRGGDQAWQRHGEPSSNAAPDWSDDESGEGFSDWAVATIPGGEQGEQEEPASRLRVVPGEAERDADDPWTGGDPEAGEPSSTTASLSVVPSPPEDATAEEAPAREPSGEDASSAAEEPSRPAHDWSVAARRAGAPGSPVDGRRSGWGYSGPDGAAGASDHPSKWLQRKQHLTEVGDTGEGEGPGASPGPGGPAPEAAPEPEDRAPAAPPQGGVAPAESHERQRHLHAVRTEEEPSPGPAAGEQRDQRSFRERHAATIAAGAQGGPRRGEPVVDPQAPEPPDDWDDFVPEPEDEDIEDSALYGQAAVETILGGRVIDERPHHQS
ncbi:DNA polymerase III subunit gamma and tau [Rothia halotolerans]|uniref:DNA polymerase III subunit gamma and tau n=1 Tax=Rothia halotolerans TaxID=405770 RepID=UPI00101CAD82|nr:DNA polymerase III subunit gamma and tau [Rothia halotolerans]